MQFITDTYLLSGKVDSINNAGKLIKEVNIGRLIILTLYFLLLQVFL